MRVVQLLPEAGPERRAVHLVARVWRDAVRYCTTKLAPRSVDTGLMKEVRCTVVCCVGRARRGLWRPRPLLPE